MHVDRFIRLALVRLLLVLSDQPNEVVGTRVEVGIGEDLPSGQFMTPSFLPLVVHCVVDDPRVAMDSGVMLDVALVEPAMALFRYRFVLPNNDEFGGVVIDDFLNQVGNGHLLRDGQGQRRSVSVGLDEDLDGSCSDGAVSCVWVGHFIQFLVTP